MKGIYSMDEKQFDKAVERDIKSSPYYKEGYQQAIQEVLDILKAEGLVGVVYKRIEALKEGK